jgi:hypothetical protein
VLGHSWLVPIWGDVDINKNQALREEGAFLET